jgi:hypothetical protein
MQDVTKTAAKKKKFRLQDIVVKTVGLVDRPAVAESEFIIMKSLSEEEGEPMTDTNTETLHPRHARAVLSAVHTIEDAAVPSGYEGDEAPKMPEKVLAHAKGLRECLRQHDLLKREDSETLEPLTTVEQEGVRYWRSFANGRTLAAHLDVHEEEAQLFDDIAKRLEAECEVWDVVSHTPILEAKAWLRTLDPKSRADVISIIEEGRRGFYD